MPANGFVPPGFEVPTELAGVGFRLTPLLPEHNDADYEAWTSSMEHIHATPGFEDRPWPVPMSKAENLRDLEGHAADFRERRGFTYTVQDPDGRNHRLRVHLSRRNRCRRGGPFVGTRRSRAPRSARVRRGVGVAADLVAVRVGRLRARTLPA